MDKHHQPFSDKNDGSGGRYYLLFWGMIFFFMIIGVRLWYLQVIKGEELRRKAESNRTEVVELPPIRGLILDRNGQVLVDNQPNFDLCVKRSAVKDPVVLLEDLSRLTRRPLDKLIAKYEALPPPKNVPRPLIDGLSREELVAVETNRWRLEGTSLQVGVSRVPQSTVLASHIIGYLGQINQKQLDAERKRIEDGIRKLVREGETRSEATKRVEEEVYPHRSGDLVGQSGIEQSMEGQLQGRRGVAKREVDHVNRVLRDIEVINPRPGYNVRLTIDSRLQALGQSLLTDRAGAIVVMDPRNFEILALASNPTFDLSDFSGGISGERWKSLQNDFFHPMTNRAVSGQYPPGSTFKIVMALVALAEGIITPETTFRCNGSLTLGNHVFRCHNRFGHGTVNLKESLKVSCDVYYYEVGRRLGVDRLAARSREFFGLGQKMGMDLLAEQAGLIPDTTWKLKARKVKWTPGDTLPVSIGQGFLLSTPLQVAQFTAVLANGGHLYRPHLVKEIVDVDGVVIKGFEAELISKIDVPPEYIAAVKKGLDAVVNEQGGSGRRAALPNFKVAGKTGTSQVVSLQRIQNFVKNQIPYDKRDHAWFTSYAPAENPEVVVTVLLEHTGGGGTFAAPVARQMLAAYFDHSIVAGELPPPQNHPNTETFTPPPFSPSPSPGL